MNKLSCVWRILAYFDSSQTHRDGFHQIHSNSCKPWSLVLISLPLLLLVAGIILLILRKFYPILSHKKWPQQNWPAYGNSYLPSPVHIYQYYTHSSLSARVGYEISTSKCCEYSLSPVPPTHNQPIHGAYISLSLLHSGTRVNQNVSHLAFWRQVVTFGVTNWANLKLRVAYVLLRG